MSDLSNYKYIPKASGTTLITVSKALIADSANSVAVANVVGMGNIATINKDGNASNILYGNGVFSAAPAAGTAYGNSNVATFLSSFGSNTISTTGNVTAGNIILSGAATTGVNSVLAGPTFTPLSNTMAGFVSNVNSYTQLTIQNKSTGADATTDFIATADNGSDTVNYLDMGIINSGYDALTPTNSLGNIVYAADSYMYAQGNSSATSQSGGNLAIGAAVAGKTVKIFAGGVTASNIVATVANTGVTVNGNVTTTGKFVGDGSSLTNITVTAAGNIIGTSPNVSLVAGSFTATFDNTGVLTLPTNGGDEGGELRLGVPATNTTLQSRVTVDVYQDRFRIFEGSGSAKGLYIDLANSPAGVGAAIGYRDIPQVVASNTTLVASDAGKHYYSTTAGNLTLTIPNNATTSFSTGTAISIVVQAAGNVLVNAVSGVTLYMAGNSTAANRYVNAYGMATLLKVGTDTWFINGTGVN